MFCTTRNNELMLEHRSPLNSAVPIAATRLNTILWNPIQGLICKKYHVYCIGLLGNKRIILSSLYCVNWRVIGVRNIIQVEGHPHGRNAGQLIVYHLAYRSNNWTFKGHRKLVTSESNLLGDCNLAKYVENRMPHFQIDWMRMLLRVLIWTVSNCIPNLNPTWRPLKQWC